MTDTIIASWKDRAAAAEANRAAMPLVTAMIDETRRIFGEGCRILYAIEGDRVLGAPGPRGFTAETQPKAGKGVR